MSTATNDRAHTNSAALTDRARARVRSIVVLLNKFQTWRLSKKDSPITTLEDVSDPRKHEWDHADPIKQLPGMRAVYLLWIDAMRRVPFGLATIPHRPADLFGPAQIKRAAAAATPYSAAAAPEYIEPRKRVRITPHHTPPAQ